MIQHIKNVLSSTAQFPKLTAFALGLYPFLHYYSSNVYMVGSWEQVLFLVFLCFILPQIIIGLSTLLMRFRPLNALVKYNLSVLSLSLFTALLGVLIFHFNKKEMLIALIVSGGLGFVLYKHLKKIIVLQCLLALLSLLTLIPKLHFAMTQNNADWLQSSDAILNAKLKHKPNIFVIQPDGYVGKDVINKGFYNYDNSAFESFLDKNNFINYSNFRSNYYSTLTSNASLFGMKHHYYSNTNKRTLKTHNATDVIVGEQNTVLKILQNNGYNSYLFTDNSYFLFDRIPLAYTYCNVPKASVSLYKNGVIKGIDIVSDFKQVLDTLPKKHNFFFIEKTIPGHVIYKQSASRGVEGERKRYLDKLEQANVWLEDLITSINAYDENALVILVADHGGFVGLEYTMEAVKRRLTNQEAQSAFSTLLSIKYPKEMDPEQLSFKSTVNLFKTVFYGLTDNQAFLEDLEPDSSYLPLHEDGSTHYYECIDTNGNVSYQKLSN